MKSNKIQSLSVNGLNPEYNDPQYITINDGSPKSLRYWQPEAFEKVKDDQYSLVMAFCGSGKSMLQNALGIYDVVSSGYKQKQLISVPQSHIHRGFVGDGELDYILLTIDGKTYEWVIQDNFCDGSNKQVLKKLKKWLLADPSELSKHCSGEIITGLNAIVTHQALSLVWQKMSEDERSKAVKNLTFRMDEFHHIKGVFLNDDDDLSVQEMLTLEAESTILGDVCRHIINKGDKTSKICGTTATPYRGDRGIILSNSVKKMFTTYSLDWLEHFKTLGIKKFVIEYEEYKGDPIKLVVNAIKKERKEKHMIVIPATTHKWRVNGKDELKSLLNALYKVIPKERVLDLVTPHTQKKNKELLLQEPKCPEDGESKYDVIVTCQLGREGTDWPPCSRLHNTSHENSITLAVQTFGRPFRRYQGKEIVKVFYYVQQFAVPKKGMSKIDLLNDRINALLVCMQIDEMCHPILLPTIKPSKVKTKDKKKSSEEVDKISLYDIFGDQYQGIKRDLFMEIECLEGKTAEDIDTVIEDIVSKYEVSEEYGEFVKNALRVLSLRALSPKLRTLGIDVKFLRENGFENIIQSYRLEGKSIFFEGNYSAKDWEAIRSILKSKWKEWAEEYKEMVKSA